MIYIHVPFCKSRCIYCDFYSTTQTADWRAKYVHALCNEIHLRKDYLPSGPLRSIYLGGGTPSQLSLSEIASIMDCIRANFEIGEDTEITLEGNPDDITSAMVRNLREMGFNRMSLGVQSFNDQILHVLNRRHTAERAVEAVHTIVDEGIENVSIDLIYGLPGQTLTDFTKDLNQAMSLPIRHLSSYALSIEEGTVLARKIESGELCQADEELFLQQYNALLDITAVHGYNHYEISNFALPAYESRHNSGYWAGIPYLGCGPGAHSFDGKNRRYNLGNLQRYIESGEGMDVPHEMEYLTENEHVNEFIMESLRTKKGLSLTILEKNFGTEVLMQVQKTAQSYIDQGLMETVSGNVRLTRSGIFISDSIMSDFMQ